MTANLQSDIDASLNPALAPVEFEADVQYPGRPVSKSSPGGRTPRRPLHSCGRDEESQEVASDPAIVETLQRLVGSRAEPVGQRQTHTGFHLSHSRQRTDSRNPLDSVRGYRGWPVARSVCGS